MNKKILSSGISLLLLGSLVGAEDINLNVTPQAIPGSPQSQNFQPTKGYGDSTVQTQLRLDVKDSTKAIHFIKDNTDPFVITKAYELKYAEPYALRGYLLSIVRATKVVGNPVEVDSVKFNDGSGLLLVSAEDYRFKDAGNGQSIDEIIKNLDRPGMAFSSGRPKFIYFPKVNAAANLREMVRNVGATHNDIEFSGGVDVLVVDGQLNALVVAGPFWSWKNIKQMIEQYDKPMPEVRITYKLVEIYSENDDKIGVDFQSWKNNAGADFFSAGGQYRSNWASTFAGGVNNSGSSRTDFFNFNPKWNSKYLDFLAAKGKAKVVTQGVLLAKNRAESTIDVSTGLFYDDVSETIPPTTVNSTIPPNVPTVPGTGGDILIQNGKKQITKDANGFRYLLKLTPVVTQKSTTISLNSTGTSLIGWDSNGSPRVSTSNFITEIQVGNTGKDFVVGGIQKAEVVRSVGGLPFVKDLPGIGYLFSTESESTKRSQLVLIARAEYALPFDQVNNNVEIKDNIGKIVDGVNKGVKSPTNNLGFQQLYFDTDKFE